MIKLVYRDMETLFNGLVHKGVAIGAGTGDYLVVIDKGLSNRERMNVLKHEIAHILLGHCATNCEGAERERREAEADAHLPSDAEITAMIQAGKIQIVQE